MLLGRHPPLGAKCLYPVACVSLYIYKSMHLDSYEKNSKVAYSGEFFVMAGCVLVRSYLTRNFDLVSSFSLGELMCGF